MIHIKQYRLFILFLAFLLAGCGSAEKKSDKNSNGTSQLQKKTEAETVSAAMNTGRSECVDAMEKVTSENKYLLILFTGGPAERVASMRDTLMKMMSESGDGIDASPSSGVV